MKYKYFSEKDVKLACSCGCGRGLKDMNPGFMNKLDEARKVANVPFIVLSGYRCSSYNRQVSYTGNYGPHTTGHAVDIVASSSRSRYHILRALFAVGFNRIGIGKGMVHVDDDPGKAKDVVWEY